LNVSGPFPVPTNQPITCPQNINGTNIISSDLVIPNGGTLICNTSENICTGEVYSKTRSQFCYPTSDSDVPGPITYLCYNDGLPTYYPRVRRVFSAGGNKWPTNAKFIFSANSIKPTNSRPPFYNAT
jgi:hypothetical protein